MISKVKDLTDEQLDRIRKMIGEAFVTNELFHNWGSEDERIIRLSRGKAHDLSAR